MSYPALSDLPPMSALKRLGAIEREIEKRNVTLEETISQCARALGVLDKIKAETAERIAETETTVKSMLTSAREQAALIVAQANAR